MRLFSALIVLTLTSAAFAQNSPQPALKSVTVPITLDHDRIVVDVYLPLPDGSSKRIRGWIDNGDPELRMSQRAAKLMGLTMACDSNSNSCLARAPHEIRIGDMPISLDAVKEAQISRYADADESLMSPGMSAEIKIPSSILRNHDVLINFPDREFTIGQPGTLNFKGVTSKMLVDADTGLIQVPSKLENKNYNFVLDLGTPVTFLSGEGFTSMVVAHPNWPRMVGAVGPANMWGGTDEVKWELMRLERLQFGPLHLTSVPVIAWPDPWQKLFHLHEKMSPAGLLGTDVLLNYRVGLDYRRSTAYFDIGSTFKLPEFDVVGLILRPDPSTHFIIMGVANIGDQPSVPTGDDGVQVGDQLVAVDSTPVADSTIGQVWSLLEGSPGQERKLTIERDGRQIKVVAKVQHFLAEAEEDQSAGKSGKKK
jgi:hypothetical protein